MKCKVILRKRLNTVLDAAEAASSAIPAAHTRIARDTYDKTVLDGLKRLSFDITRENMELLREYGYIVQAFYYKSVNNGTRRFPNYVYEFTAIPVDSVGRKANIVYIVEGRVG